MAAWVAFAVPIANYQVRISELREVEMTFGHRVRQKIDELRGGMSLQSLAEQAGMSKRTLEKWGAKTTLAPKEESVIKVLKALDISEDQARLQFKELQREYAQDNYKISHKQTVVIGISGPSCSGKT